jgi:hypothetical protein
MLAERMICLPIYSQTTAAEIAELHRIIKASLARSLKQAA